MAHRWKNDLTRNDVTPKAAFMNRRQLMASALGLGAGAAGMATLGSIGATPVMAQDALVPNTLEEITSYNNFYEFGTAKDDPVRHAQALEIDPWSITVEGMVDNPGTYSLAEIMDGLTTEERIYRFRCVEAWSMVVPWNGVELADILNKVGVQAGAKYVGFQTAIQPGNMPGVQRGVMPFPYVEGLRLDEAMHPLTMMATGIYDEPIAKQNGAPIRLVVPWKYGFKSIKSIVRIKLTDEQPASSWNAINPGEYGFYSNVNPTVDHPRWSQATERKIGGGLFAARQDTLMFNGYEAEVADLYADQDLAVDY